MKTWLTCIGMLIITGAWAQPTFNAASYVAAAYFGNDTFGLVSGGSLPSLAPAMGGSYDFSGVSYDAAVHLRTYYSPLAITNFPAPGFPAANYLSTAGLPVIGSYSVSVFNAGEVDGGGIQYPGIFVNAQSFYLGSGTDSIVVPKQTVHFTGSRLLLPFPATYGIRYSSSYRDTLNFTITAAAAGLNHAPGFIVRRYQVLDSIVGYGQAAVKSLAGSVYGNIPVLQVRERSYTNDSFYINGAPASPLLLGAQSASQNMRQVTAQTLFYRNAEITPLVEITHTDTTFAGTPAGVASANIDQRRLRSYTGVSAPAVFAAATAYPNPLAGRSLSVSLPGALPGTYRYRIISTTGQVVTTGRVEAPIGRIALQEPLPAGVYGLELRIGGQQWMLPLVSAGQ